MSVITKRRVQKKQAEYLEKKYNETIQKVNQAKIQFFINISHEIRTPLTLIMCSIERLVENFKKNPQQEKEVKSIEINVSHMLNLTNELLEIQKIESGNYQINVRKNDIIDFLKNIVLAFDSLAERQNINLSFYSFQSEILIWFDANAIEKAFGNLISNAIKYTKRGGAIEVSINSSENNEFLDITVSDNGIGIEKVNFTKIFDRFYHLESNSESYEKGFGVGLSLSKNLIESHKGSISLSSEVGKGSIFTLRLPMNDEVYSSEDKAENLFWK